MPNSICLHAEIWNKYPLKNGIIACSLLFSRSFIRRHHSMKILYVTLYKSKLNYVFLLLGYYRHKSRPNQRLCWLSCFVVVLHSFQVHSGLNVATTMTLHNMCVIHYFLKLYNEQRNAQVFNLFIYLLLPYMFRAFF
jgi:hypothetical protein